MPRERRHARPAARHRRNEAEEPRRTPTSVRSVGGPPAFSGLAYRDALDSELRQRGLRVPDPRDPEPLAGLDYGVERTVKSAALDAFWKAHDLGSRPEPLVPAPLPRGYRTTTKRRVIQRRDGLAFAFPGISSGVAGVASSSLDAPEHLTVYRHLHAQLGHRASEALAETLSWIVVRGSAPALSVVLNVRLFDGDVVRAAKRIAAGLESASLGVASSSLYLDPSGSDYYLDADRPSGVLSRKRLLGPDWLEQSVAGARLRFPPTVFSQVNGAMVGTMVETVTSILGSPEGHCFLDLYCGYGLFSLTVGQTARRVIGVDLAGPAVDAAVANARHANHPGRFRFLAVDLTAEAIASRLPAPGREPELVLLDPPRQGTAQGIAAALAERGPARVLHICCGSDELPRELRAWKESGYRVERVIPLDLFPGTAGLETLVLLVPSR